MDDVLVTALFFQFLEITSRSSMGLLVVTTMLGQQSRPSHKPSWLAEDGAAPKLPCRLLDLPAELLVAVASQLAEDDVLAASFACRKLREAVAGTERHTTGVRLSTRIGSALGSVGKLEWAASCGMPLSAKLLTRVARLGQLEPLRWLRAHGCTWEPCRQGREGACSCAAEGGHLSVLQ
jgi:hypothetical protein